MQEIREAFEDDILILEELGRGLTSFKFSKELLSVLGDAAEAHQQAHDQAGILHQDISANNIIITENGVGLLVDWDLAIHLDDIQHDTGTLPKWVGTIEFLSARFVDRIEHLSSTPHNRMDDMESMFCVLQWVVLRYVKHGMHKEELGARLCSTFHEVLKAGDKIISMGRFLSIMHSIFRSCVSLNNVLGGVLEDLRNIFYARCTPIDKMGKAPSFHNMRFVSPTVLVDLRNTTCFASYAYAA